VKNAQDHTAEDAPILSCIEVDGEMVERKEWENEYSPRYWLAHLKFPRASQREALKVPPASEKCTRSYSGRCSNLELHWSRWWDGRAQRVGEWVQSEVLTRAFEYSSERQSWLFIAISERQSWLFIIWNDCLKYLAILERQTWLFLPISERQSWLFSIWYDSCDYL